MAILMVEAIKNGSIFISSRRGRVVAASLVCKVERSKWPVKAALTAIAAVSSSRISPTIIIFGSCLKIDLRPLAKVKLVLELT